MTRALITGVAGQDGAYLAHHLNGLGYRVLGTVPDTPLDGDFVSAYLDRVDLHVVDIADRHAMRELLEQERPDELYNLASISSVAQSWARPVEVTLVNGVSVVGLLEDLRDLRDRTGYAPRVCQASSAEIFGTPARLPQRAGDPIEPTNPYAVAKALAHQSVRNYRQAYGMYACSVILFNHESPLRPASFVTRKITSSAVEIAAGRLDRLELGRLDVRRDWGFAGDYVAAMHLALQAEAPADVVVATGVSRPLGDFVATALSEAGAPEREGLVTTSPAFVRPLDIPEMRGDPTAAEALLGWRRSVSFNRMVGQMVRADERRAATGKEHDPGFLIESLRPA